MTQRHARRFITVYERFSKRTPGTDLPKSVTVLEALTSFTDEELSESYELPSGEKKKPTEMSRREIEELKRKLKAEKAERERLEQQSQHRYSSYLYKIVPLRLKFRRIALGDDT